MGNFTQVFRAMVVGVLGAGVLGGCSTSIAPAGAEVSAGQYAEAFQAARDVLREKRFSLERIDAPQGILTTQPKSAPGLAKPWESAPGLNQAGEDLVEYQQRVVRVAFIPKGESAEAFPRTDVDRDLLERPTDTLLQVRVGVERFERPGFRVSTDAVRLKSQTIDPEMEKAGMLPRYIVPVRDDNLMAGEILNAILARMNAGK